MNIFLIKNGTIYKLIHRFLFIRKGRFYKFTNFTGYFSDTRKLQKPKFGKLLLKTHYSSMKSSNFTLYLKRFSTDRILKTLKLWSFKIYESIIMYDTVKFCH